MSESLSDVARETAMVEALTLYPLIQGWPEMNRGRRLQQKAYAKGAGVAVGRLPSRDEIARTMALTDDYDGCFERVDAWNNATQELRDCGDVDEPLSFDGEDCEFWLKRADAVLALIRSGFTGEDASLRRSTGEGR